jgi:putative transposase
MENSPVSATALAVLGPTAMAYWRLHYHLVWATTLRQPLISADTARVIEQALYRKARELGVTIHQLGGVEEHIHVVVSIPPRVAVAGCLQQFKGVSSYAVNSGLHHAPRFRWQDGYGVLTLGESSLARVIDYVRRQREHHATGELLAALEQCEPSVRSEPGLPGARISRT